MHQAAHGADRVAFDRAFNGSDEPIYNREGQVVGRKHRQSDAMIMFLLRKHFPTAMATCTATGPNARSRRPPRRSPTTIVALQPCGPPIRWRTSIPRKRRCGSTWRIWPMANCRLSIDRTAASRHATPTPPPTARPRFRGEAEAAKRAGNPTGFAAAEERRAMYDEEEAEERDRRARRRRRG